MADTYAGDMKTIDYQHYLSFMTTKQEKKRITAVEKEGTENNIASTNTTNNKNKL